jgi:dTDP-4-dehydrorhamnose reductase
MKIIILGANGLIGYNILTTFLEDSNFEVLAFVRDKKKFNSFGSKFLKNIITDFSILNLPDLENTILNLKPDAVINCIGVTKHRISEFSIDKVIYANSLFPHYLLSICEKQNIRCIQISTDCVFSGTKGNYSEADVPDALDLYGKTKSLGELITGNSLTLRISTIGFELDTKYGLLEWFLSQRGECFGYSKAYFSGLPCKFFAKILADILVHHKELKGLYHIASEPIDKLSLLELIKDTFKLNVKIKKNDTFLLDRSLDARKFNLAISSSSPKWLDLAKTLKEFN